MITDLKETAFPDAYARFVELFDGDKFWLKVTEKQELQIKANRYAKPRILKENRVAYGLTAFDLEGLGKLDSPDWPNIQHAISFAAQVCEIVDKTHDEAGKQSYLGRIRGAFSNQDEMRAIRFEHLTALTLHRHGGQVEWPETKSGPEHFDILVSNREGGEVEVECKSCSADKGRAITEKDAAQLFQPLMTRLQAVAKPGDVIMVKVRMPKRLPTSLKALNDLAENVVQAMESGESLLAQDVTIATRRYQTRPGTGLDLSPEAMKNKILALAKSELNAGEGHSVFEYDPETSVALYAEVCSGRSSAFFNAAWVTVKHAVQKQMTGARPGCLVLRLEGMIKEKLAQLGKETPNTLAIFATKVLTDKRHEHLACMAFISDETLTATSDMSIAPHSCSYVFNRPDGGLVNTVIGKQLLGEYQSHD